MGYLNIYDRRIIHYLAKTGAQRNTNQIASKLKMSWNTADSHLKKLYKMGYVTGKKRRDSIYWRINR